MEELKGSIETLREALKKTKKHTRSNLKKVVKTYNGLRHRGINMCPMEAMEEKNYEKVRETQEKYRKEFERKNLKLEQFREGDDVLIRNEFKTNKMDDAFQEKGMIKKILYKNAYEVITAKGKTIKRHGLQLKRDLNRGMSDKQSETCASNVDGFETETDCYKESI